MATSLLTHAERDSLKETLVELGGTVLAEWGPSVNHLVMSSFKMSVKVRHTSVHTSYVVTIAPYMLYCRHTTRRFAGFIAIIANFKSVVRITPRQIWVPEYNDHLFIYLFISLQKTHPLRPTAILCLVSNKQEYRKVHIVIHATHLHHTFIPSDTNTQHPVACERASGRVLVPRGIPAGCV